MKNFFIASVSIIALLIVGACNKSSQLGADLFDGEKLNLKFSDTLITVRAESENPDSVTAFNFRTASISTFSLLPLGKMYDPVFGITEARINGNFTNSASLFTLDTTAGVSYTLDSVVFVMAYNAADTYGDTTQQQKVSLYRFDATESITSNFANTYTNKKYKTEATPLGSLTFKPTPNTHVKRTDTTYFKPHISFRLKDDFGKALIDTTNYKSYKDDIGKYFRGFELRAEQTTNAMMSFNIGDDSTGIILHYRKKGDTVALQYRFPFSSTSHPYFNHNYSTGTINKYFNGKKTAAGDSLLFVQGMAGPNVKFEFPNLKQQLGTAAVNRAELEFTIVEDSTDKYLPIEQFILTTSTGVLVSDLTRTGTTSVVEFGGGIVTEAGNLRRYKCNISQHLQNMLYGRAGTILYLVPDNGRGTTPNIQGTTRRVVLYGTGHPKYRAKLNLYYTKP